MDENRREKNIMKSKTRIALLAGLLILLTATYARGLENKYLKVEAGGKGLMVTSKAGGTTVELVLVDKKGGVKGKLNEGQVKLPAGQNFIEVSPAGEALEVRIKSRFAFIPEFYGADALFDPTITKQDLLYVAAENFLISVAEGGKGGVMFLWPSDGKQLPMLVAEGEGEARRFTKMRVTFDKKSVFVAVMDHPQGLFPYITGLSTKDLAYNKRVKSTRTYKYAEVKSGWKFPYDAMWWTILTKPIEGPVTGMPGHSFRVTKSTFSWNDIEDVYRLPTAKHSSGEWVLELEERKRYRPRYSALTYPRTRVVRAAKRVPFGKTPADVVTLTDVIFNALGKDAYDKVIGREGVRPRGCAPKGEPLVWATCGGSWSLWCTVGCDCSNIRKGDRGKPNKEKFYKTTQGLMHFVDYGVKRIKEYRDMSKAVIKLCDEESAKNPKLKNAAEKIAKAAKAMEELWEKEDHHYNKAVNEKRKKFANTKKGNATVSPWDFLTDEEAKNISMASPGVMQKLRDWCRKLYDEYAEKDQPTMAKLYGITRMQWTEAGGRMDGILVFSRKTAQSIRQQAALIAVDSPEARELALKVRKMAMDSLKYFHYKEEVARPEYTAQMLTKWRSRPMTSH